MVLQHSSLSVSLQIKQVRRATREEKKRKAMAMREKELGALGLQVSCSLPHIHTQSHSHICIDLIRAIIFDYVIHFRMAKVHKCH